MNNDISADEDYNHLYKIVLVGDAAVGKTHLLNRYIKGTLPKSNAPTIGVEFATRTVTLANGGKVKAQIWDTAGQERYRAITSTHYRRALGALLIYDVTKERSFENITQWMVDLKQSAEPDLVIMLVGNKVDLVKNNPSMRKVSREEAIRFAQANGLLFEETSAVSALNVVDVFEKLLQEIYEKKTQERPNKGTHLVSKKQDENDKCC